MLCQFPLPVFFDNFPDFVHPLDHEHMGIPKIVFGAIAVLKQEGIVLCIKGIDGVQQAGKVIVDAAPPDKGVPVCVRFDFGPINVKFFQRNKAFLLQAAHELVIQIVQDLSLIHISPAAALKPGFAPIRGRPPNSVPLGQRYLQNHGSPIPVTVTATVAGLSLIHIWPPTTCSDRWTS